MTKSRILLFLFIAISTILLYLLPRFVVSTTEQEISDGSGNTEKAIGGQLPEAVHDHAFQIPDSMATIIERFYESFATWIKTKAGTHSDGRLLGQVCCFTEDK